MNIGIDIDGCLMDLTDFSWIGMPLFLKEKGIKYNPNYPPLYSERKQFNISYETEDEFWNSKYAYEYYFDRPPRLFSKEILQKLKEEGNKIYIITARNNNYGNKNFTNDTLEYLKKHNIPYDEIYFDCGNKVNHINMLNIDIMLEDSEENVKEIYKSTNCYTYIFDTYCNESIKNNNRITRVYSMIDFYEKIKINKEI